MPRSWTITSKPRTHFQRSRWEQQRSHVKLILSSNCWNVSVFQCFIFPPSLSVARQTRLPENSVNHTFQKQQSSTSPEQTNRSQSSQTSPGQHIDTRPWQTFAFFSAQTCGSLSTYHEPLTCGPAGIPRSDTWIPTLSSSSRLLALVSCFVNVPSRKRQ